jgi:hypothetical protein
MMVNVLAALACAAIGDVPLSVVYATNAKIEPRVKVVGAFPDNPHDPIVYSVAATVNAKPRDDPISGVSAISGGHIDIRGLRLFGAGKAHIERIEDLAP